LKDGLFRPEQLNALQKTIVTRLQDAGPHWQRRE
jgi:hypothetical protein